MKSIPKNKLTPGTQLAVKKIAVKVRQGILKNPQDFSLYHINIELNDDTVYLNSLLGFYRTLKRKHVEDNAIIMDWANTGLLKWWVENEDPNLVPDRYYIMAEVLPSDYKGKRK